MTRWTQETFEAWLIRWGTALARYDQYVRDTYPDPAQDTVDRMERIIAAREAQERGEPEPVVVPEIRPPRPALIRTGPRLGTYRPPAPPSTVNVGENKRHGGKVRIKRRYGEADVVRILEIRTDLHGLGIDLLTRALCAEWGYVSRTTVQRGLATYRNLYGDTYHE